jgi:hypothetical protein
MAEFVASEHFVKKVLTDKVHLIKTVVACKAETPALNHAEIILVKAAAKAYNA